MKWLYKPKPKPKPEKKSESEKIKEKSCQSKRAYDSEALARAVGMQRCIEMDRTRSYKTRLFTYRCEICGHWHLTKSKQQDNPSAITARELYNWYLPQAEVKE